MIDADFGDFRPWVNLKNVLGEKSRRYAKDVAVAVSKIDGAELIVKPHYKQEDRWKRYMETVAPENLDWKVVSHKSDVFGLEAKSDLVITIESSVISEAVMLKKPVIALCYGPELLSEVYLKDGIVECATSRESLENAVCKCLNDTEFKTRLGAARERVFHAYAGPFDGRNTERATNLILNDHV
jgi:CDP-glycerol glycerophosphotransferase (TagB/SpsB family)